MDEFNIILLQVITRFRSTERTKAGLSLPQSMRMHVAHRTRWLYFTHCVEKILYVNSYNALSADYA